MTPARFAMLSVKYIRHYAAFFDNQDQLTVNTSVNHKCEALSITQIKIWCSTALRHFAMFIFVNEVLLLD